MNKILIHKGDSTVFGDVTKFLAFTIKTNLDLTGYSAKFILGWVTKEVTDISSKKFDIILGSQDTNQLRLGAQYGSIILTDSNGNIKTIVNTIPFEVTTKVIENEYQEVDLSIPESSGVDLTLRVGSTGASGVTSYELLSDLPNINDVELVGNKTLEELGIQPAGNYLKSIPSEYITETELTAKGYLTEHQDISGLATKEELLVGLATKQTIGDYALKTDIPSVEGFVTEGQVTELLATKQDAGDYVTREEFNSSLADIETLLQGV